MGRSFSPLGRLHHRSLHCTSVAFLGANTHTDFLSSYLGTQIRSLLNFVRERVTDLSRSLTSIESRGKVHQDESRTFENRHWLILRPFPLESMGDDRKLNGVTVPFQKSKGSDFSRMVILSQGGADVPIPMAF